MVAIKKTTRKASEDVVKKVVPKVAVKKTSVKKTALKKVVSKKTVLKKSAAKKTVAAKKVMRPVTVLDEQTPRKTARAKKPAVATSKAASKNAVTNDALHGMIESNLTYVSKARRPVFVDSEVMPTEYGSTSITLLARDPHWVHAYWEVAPSSLEQMRQAIGHDVVERCAWVLRVYDVSLINFNGSNANHWFDISVGMEANHWYINLWSDHITCCADIGLRAPDGTFHMLARSNYITTPREYLSPRHDVIWMEVQPDEEARPYVYVGREPEPGQLDAGGAQSRRFRLYLTEEEIRAYYSRLFPLLSRILSLRGKRKRGKGKAVLSGDADARDEHILLLEHLEGLDLFDYEYFKRILLGASEEMMLRGRKLFEVLGGASEQFAPSSAGGASEQKSAPQDFFFELGTELIVYGRTEPDAVVFWGDRMIPLREDGTFSLRMALPTDTHIPLDFKAISYRKKEQRTIITAAHREKTEYGN